ncbi:MAG: hypothetical protein ABIP46_10785 [Polaromonas sp.]
MRSGKEFGPAAGCGVDIRVIFQVLAQDFCKNPADSPECAEPAPFKTFVAVQRKLTLFLTFSATFS